MFLLFALSILVKSVDYAIDFTQSDYDLFLNSSGVFIRQLNENAENAIVYESTNIEDFTVHLNISLSFNESKEVHLLNIIVDPMKVNLDLEIQCLNQNTLHPGIKVYDQSNKEDDYYNYYTITIHSDTIFYYDMKNWSIGTIESYTLNNKLTARVSLSEDKSFYDSYSYICYKSADCTQQEEIRPYDSYFTALDDTMLNLMIDDIYVNEYDQSFYILFLQSGDFPVINNKITGKNVHLKGITNKPVQLSIGNDINIDQLILTNIQFVKKNQGETLNLQFESIFIKDETKDVFPTDRCTITCENFYEYTAKDKKYQSQSIEVTGKRSFYILSDFEANEDLTLILSNNKTEVKNAKGDLLATVPVVESYSKTAIHIENQKNLNRNKIVIRNEFTDLEEKLIDSLDINLENCGQIPIDFVDWNNDKLSEFTINIYNDLIYDEIVTNINSSYLNYAYNTGEDTIFSFPKDATKVVLCLSAETCSQPELAGNDVYQYPINGQDITEFVSSHGNIEKLVLVLNDEQNGKTLSLPENIPSLKFLSFIYNGETNPFSITLSSFPYNDKIDLEIKNCLITADPVIKVKNLFVPEDVDISSIESDTKVTVKDIIDISDEDQDIELTSEIGSLKLLVKRSEAQHNIIFKSDHHFNCTIYVQCCDRNFADIPISFIVDGSVDNPNEMRIRTINHERIIFTSIPTDVKVTVKFDDTNVVQYFIPVQSDKVSICYNNVLCKQDDSELSTDEIYLSSNNEKDFASLIDMLKQNGTEDYEYIRLIFQNNRDYEDVDFSQIPADMVKQIQLTSYGGDEDEDTYLILNSNMENKNITSWLFEPRVFFWRSNDEKRYTFNEISFNSDSEDYILEMLDNMYENYYIEAFRLPLAFASSVYNYLVDSNLILNFGEVYIDIEPNKNEELYLEITDNNLMINDQSIDYSNLSSLYLRILDNDEINEQIVKINITDDTIDRVNLIIAQKVGKARIDFICSEASMDSNFELNLSIINHIDVEINEHSCNNIDSSVYMESNSSTFKFDTNGFYEEGRTDAINSTINRIIFSNKNIEISEDNEYNTSDIFYFVSSVDEPVITINKNVTNTKIGIISFKSPTVILQKDEYPLSFLNTYDNYIDIKIGQKDSYSTLVFDEVNNQQGQFHLDIPPSIASVSFSDIKMSKVSSFEIKHKVENSPIKLLSYVNETINVRDSLVISPESYSKLRNLELNGTLYIDDDSTLILNGTTIFSDDSTINLNAKSSNNGNEKDNYIINCVKALETVPSSINVFIKNDGKININNLKIIGPLKSKEICESLGSKISFEDGRKVSSSNSCTENENGEYFLSLSAKEKKSNKLSAGAIAGIVIACVVVVALIIGLIVYCAKRKINIDISSKENEEDSCAF